MKKRSTHTDLATALKKLRRQELRQELKNGFLEMFAEIFFYLLLLIIGIGAASIFGISNSDMMDEDLMILLGLCVVLPLLAIISLIVLLFKKQKNPKDAKEESLPKPKIYNDLQSLYDDLSIATDHVRLNDFQIDLTYGEDTLTIKKKKYTFSLSANGILQKGTYHGNNIYPLAVEFVHEKRNDISELTIFEKQLINWGADGITYKDKFERIHFIDFSLCAENHEFSHIGIGSDKSITFHTPEIKTKIIFRKAERTSELKQFIAKNGYQLDLIH